MHTVYESNSTMEMLHKLLGHRLLISVLFYAMDYAMDYGVDGFSVKYIPENFDGNCLFIPCDSFDSNSWGASLDVELCIRVARIIVTQITRIIMQLRDNGVPASTHLRVSVNEP